MATGKLFLIPTIISPDTQFDVICAQSINVIKDLKYFLVENARTSRRFVSSLKLGIDIEALNIEVLDKRSDSGQLTKLMSPIYRGENIGLMSESGCPGIADPGALAVEYAHRNDISVIPLVGPSSILMTLMASGFNGQSFAFHGYLPIDKKERQKKITQLESIAIKSRQTQIFMDTPYRNKSLFDDLINTCNPETLICIARDITGKDEMIKTRKVKDWKQEGVFNLEKIPTVFAINV